MTVGKKILDALERFQARLTNAFFVLTIVVVSFQVINRYWLQWPIIWTADLAVLCFVWLGFLSASTAVRKYGHFRVTIVLDLKIMEGAGRRALEMFSIVVIAAVSLLLIAEGSRITITGLRESAPGLGISMAFAYAAVPVCSLTALVFALEKGWEQLRGQAPGSAAPASQADAY